MRQARVFAALAIALALGSVASAKPKTSGPLGDPNTVPFTAGLREVAAELDQQGIQGPSKRSEAVADSLASIVFPLDRDGDGEADPAPTPPTVIVADIDSDGLNDLVVPADLDGDGVGELYVVLGPVSGNDGRVALIGHDYVEIGKILQSLPAKTDEQTSRLLESIQDEAKSFASIIR